VRLSSAVLQNLGLLRRITSANRYGSLLAKTGSKAVVLYKKQNVRHTTRHANLYGHQRGIQQAL